MIPKRVYNCNEALIRLFPGTEFEKNLFLVSYVKYLKDKVEALESKNSQLESVVAEKARLIEVLTEKNKNQKLSMNGMVDCLRSEKRLLIHQSTDMQRQLIKLQNQIEAKNEPKI